VRLSEAFFAFMIYVLSQLITGVAIIAALRLRTEESSGRAEPLLTAPVSRVSWAGSHLLMAVVSPAIVLLALGIGGGLSSGNLGRVVLASIAYLPATWVLVGIAVALFGLAPRIAVAVSWTALGLFLFVDLLAEFKLIADATFLSPYLVVPNVLLPSSGSSFGLLVVTLLAASLVAVGLLGWRRRDLASG
jgi:ABC-2 type transport system permease protein